MASIEADGAAARQSGRRVRSDVSSSHENARVPKEHRRSSHFGHPEAARGSACAATPGDDAGMNIPRPDYLPQEAGLYIGSPKVLRQWTDHNGHMNLAAYLIAFDRCFSRFCDQTGIGPRQIPLTGKSIFVAETHLVYRRELLLGDQVDVGIRITHFSPKRIIAYLSMFHRDSGELACVNEQLDVCVDLATRHSSLFPSDVHTRLALLHAREAGLPPPPYAGHGIRMPDAVTPARTDP